MLLDSSTRRNLELCETMREKQKRGSLLWVLDKTKTAMGARTTAQVYRTAVDRRKKEIDERLDAVEEFKEQCDSQEKRSREYLTPVYDLERLVRQDYIPVCQSKRSDCF